MFNGVRVCAAHTCCRACVLSVTYNAWHVYQLLLTIDVTIPSPTQPYTGSISLTGDVASLLETKSADMSYTNETVPLGHRTRRMCVDGGEHGRYVTTTTRVASLA